MLSTLSTFFQKVEPKSNVIHLIHLFPKGGAKIQCYPPLSTFFQKVEPKSNVIHPYPPFSKRWSQNPMLSTLIHLLEKGGAKIYYRRGVENLGSLLVNCHYFYNVLYDLVFAIIIVAFRSTTHCFYNNLVVSA